GEREDAVAVVGWARAAYPGRALYLGGFSFGAGVAATVADRADAAVLATVALPVARLAGGFDAPPCPWLIVHGSEDELVPVDDVRVFRDERAPDAQLIVLDGATHFFHGKLTELGQRVQAFVADAAGERAKGATESRGNEV